MTEKQLNILFNYTFDLQAELLHKPEKVKVKEIDIYKQFYFYNQYLS